MRSEQKSGLGAARLPLRQGEVCHRVYSSTALAAEHAEQLGPSSELPIQEGIQVCEKALARTTGGCCQVLVDFGEPDKYSVGNNREQIEICPDDSFHLKLAGQCLHNSWSNNKQFVTMI